MVVMYRPPQPNFNYFVAFCDGTDNGLPLYRERYVGREEETPEVGGDEELRRSIGDEEGVGYPDGLAGDCGLRNRRYGRFLLVLFTSAGRRIVLYIRSLFRRTVEGEARAQSPRFSTSHKSSPRCADSTFYHSVTTVIVRAERFTNAEAKVFPAYFCRALFRTPTHSETTSNNMA
jgi:hypothetical protein